MFGQDGTSKGKRLGCYLRVSDPKDAAKALRALWDYREALLARSGEAEKVKNASARFFDLIRKLEGGTPSPSEPTPKPRVDKTLLDKLNAELMDGLDLADTLRRGLHLQTVLLEKVRHAGETGAPFMRVRDLFPE